MSFAGCLCEGVQHEDGTCYSGWVPSKCPRAKGLFCQDKIDYDKTRGMGRGVRYRYSAPRLFELQEEQKQKEQQEINDYEDD